MAESKDIVTVFQSNILENTSQLITERAIPWITKRLLAELDEYIRRFKEGCFGDGCVPRKRSIQPPVNRDFDAIMKIFSQRRKEKQRFCKVYPDWKENRESTMKEMQRSAQELHEKKTQMDKLNTTANILSLSAGLVRATLLYSQTLLPKWARMMATTSSIIGSGIKAVTNSAEHYHIETHLMKAEKHIKSDKEQFKILLRWIEYDDDLTDSIAAAIGTHTMQRLFENFQNFYDTVKESNENHRTGLELVEKLGQATELLIGNNYAEKVMYAGVLLQIFLVHYADRDHCNWTEAAKSVERLKTGCKVIAYSANTVLSVQQLRDEHWNTPAATCFGVAVDVLPAVFDMCTKNTETVSDQAENIEAVVRKLKDEINYFDRIYNELKEKDLVSIQQIPGTEHRSRRKSF